MMFRIKYVLPLHFILKSILVGCLFSYGLQCFGQSVKQDYKLTKELEGLVKDFEGVAGVYALNLKHHREAFVNADTLFPTASIVKVPILAGIFKKIADGELHYHESLTYRDSMALDGSGFMQYFKDSTMVDLSMAVNLMMAYSDNTASVWCQNLAGGGAAINSFLQKNGYQYTRVNSRTKGREAAYKQYGWGQTTPREMAHLLVRIRNHELLSPQADDRMYRDMSKAYWDEYALAEIPPYVQTASKQGMVNASRSELVMVNAPHGDYVFYVATKENKDKSWELTNEAWELARKISKLLWNYYEPRDNWNSEGSRTFWN